MSEIKRSILFGKLNPIAYKAVESATIFCKMRGNPYVELVHWLNQIFQLADSDLHRIIKHFGLNTSRLATDLTAALDRLPRGATSISDFSPHLEEAVQQGWVFGSLLFGENKVRICRYDRGERRTRRRRRPGSCGLQCHGVIARGRCQRNGDGRGCVHG